MLDVDIKCELALGLKVRETVTGVIGTITGIADYLHEDTEYRIEWCDNSGFLNVRWLTAGRLQVI